MVDKQLIKDALNTLGSQISDHNKLDAICAGYVKEAEAVRIASEKAAKAGAPTTQHQIYMMVLLNKANANKELRDACFKKMMQALDIIMKVPSDTVLALCQEDVVAQTNICALMDFIGAGRPTIFGKLEVN